MSTKYFDCLRCGTRLSLKNRISVDNTSWLNKFFIIKHQKEIKNKYVCKCCRSTLSKIYKESIDEFLKV